MKSPFATATWRSVVGLVAVPLVIVSLLGWAFWSPTADHGGAKAAIVNDDQMVTVAGKPVPLGRELAGKLVHSPDSGYSWALTDQADAQSGLADGTYAAVVTIPRNFSARAISASTATGGGNPRDASAARIDVRTSDRGGVADPLASDDVAKAAVAAFNRQLVQTYLDNIYVGFNTVHDQLHRTADGAHKLADGARQLGSGAHRLADGTATLNSAAGRLDDGARQLATGSGALAGGSGTLADGLGQLHDRTADLPALTRKLADGARQVAAGNKRLAATLVPIADKVVATVDALPTARQAADRFTAMATECPARGGDRAFCATLTAAAHQFATQAGALDAGRDTLRGSAVQLRTALTGLADGAGKVAKGNTALAAAMPALTGGIGKAAGGARQLHTGAGKLDDGAHQLAGGTHQLAANTPALADGAGTLADGSRQVAGGTATLASGLATGAAKAPSYSPADRDHLKQVAATPAAATTSTAPLHAGVIVLLVALALWAGTLITALRTRTAAERDRTSRRPTWWLAVRAALPSAAVATITATVLSLALAPFLDLGVGAWFALLGTTVLAANTFAAVNHTLVTILHRPGRFASIAVLVLTVAFGIVTTVPAFFATAGAFLPTAGAIEALRAVTTGTAGAAAGLLQLAAWLAAATVATLVVTDRRRALPTKALRLGPAT